MNRGPESLEPGFGARDPAFRVSSRGDLMTQAARSGLRAQGLFHTTVSDDGEGQGGHVIHLRASSENDALGRVKTAVAGLGSYGHFDAEPFDAEAAMMRVLLAIAVRPSG